MCDWCRGQGGIVPGVLGVPVGGAQGSLSVWFLRYLGYLAYLGEATREQGGRGSLGYLGYLGEGKR